MTSVHHSGDVRIFEKECVSLAEAGWAVTLIAPGAPVRSSAVKILTIPKPGTRVRRMTATTIEILRVAHGLPADVYHIHDPELVPVGLALRAAGRVVVYDVHEDLPRQILGKPWIPGLLRGATAAVAGIGEGLAARALSGLVAATTEIADRFPAEKTVVVRNYPRQQAGHSQIPYGQRENLVVYVGGVTAIRGAREMAASTDYLTSPEVRLLLVGPLESSELNAELARSPRVHVDGWRRHQDVQDILAVARVGLCVLHPLRNYVESLPTKLFEYMAAGLPVVVSDFPGWRHIVTDSDCGLLVDPLDPEAIGSAVQYLLDNPVRAQEMGERGRASVEARYRWEIEFDSLLGLYERLARGRRAAFKG